MSRARVAQNTGTRTQRRKNTAGWRNTPKPPNHKEKERTFEIKHCFTTKSLTSNGPSLHQQNLTSRSPVTGCMSPFLIRKALNWLTTCGKWGAESTWAWWVGGACGQCVGVDRLAYVCAYTSFFETCGVWRVGVEAEGKERTKTKGKE